MKTIRIIDCQVEVGYSGYDHLIDQAPMAACCRTYSSKAEAKAAVETARKAAQSPHGLEPRQASSPVRVKWVSPCWAEESEARDEQW